MSEDNQRSGDESEERPELKLGIPEKQPLDLGIHKIVFSAGSQPDSILEEGIKPPTMEAIIIVQDEYREREDHRVRGVRNNLIRASVICLIFIAMEFLGGFISNSLVIAADATQLLTVFSTMMVSLFSLQLSRRPPSHSTPLSWYRPEVMAALFSVLSTWVLTSMVIYLAVRRIVNGDFVLDVDMMLATSAFGVVANLLMGMILHNNCQASGGGECSVAVNINVRAAFMHIVCDFLFSLGVFITALFIDCCPDWHIVDPISTVMFSVLVLFVTMAILRDVLHVLVEGIPKGVYLDEVLKTLLTVEGVQQVDNLRLWALSLDKTALSAHLTIRPGVDHNTVLKNASRLVHCKYDFYEMTLHLEAFQENMTDDDNMDHPEKK